MISLDPRKITGPITNKTPPFVLEYIARFIKIPFHIEYYDEIINSINEYEYYSVEIENDNDLSKIIKFVSPFGACNEWIFENIITALDHILSFSIGYEPPTITFKEIVFGDKTNDNPLNYNQLIIYRIANIHGYNMDRDTTIDEIRFFIEKICESKVNVLKNSLLHTINSMSNVDILKLYFNISNNISLSSNEESIILPDIRHPQLSFDPNIFEITLNNFFDKKQIVSRIKVKTNYEAIIMAAIKYRINIIDSSSPIKELDSISRRTYLPVCQSFSVKYNLNRDFYNINRRWTEQLSIIDIYTLEQLKDFAVNEGFDRILTLSFNELNSYLKSSRCMFNFYFGKHPYCKKTKTIMLTPLDEVDDDQLLCFGIENINELFYITVDELTEYFLSTKMYIDPISNKPIEKRVINKIKLWCRNYRGNSSYNVRKLISSIDELDKIERLLDISCQRIKINILSSDISIKLKVKEFLNNAMELGLYMRGWKVIDNIDFPLESQNTLYNESEIVSDEFIIDKSIYAEIEYTAKQKVIDNTQIAHEKVLESLMSLPTDILCDIKKLHILKFSKLNKSTEILGYLFKGTHIYQSETLVDCLKNIFKGMDDPDACMRTNSNWILYSSIWYMIVFGYEIPFRIDRIDDIM